MGYREQHLRLAVLETESAKGKLLNPGVWVQLSYKARQARSVMDECEGLDSSSSEATQGEPRSNHHTRGL